MITVYSMKACPDCAKMERRLAGSGGYRVRDIGESAAALKEFLRLRDTHPLFDGVKATGSIGIPCFVLEDGSVTLSPEEAGLSENRGSEAADGTACRLDGKGC